MDNRTREKYRAQVRVMLHLTREARAMAGRTTAVGRGVEALFCGTEPRGIERGLPRGDM